VPVLRVERGHAAADAELASRDADDHEPVPVERRQRDRVAVLPARDLRRPDRLPGLLVERDERPVEPQQLVEISWFRLPLYCQRICPLAALTAKTSAAVRPRK
jgi:hypothetical protein